MKGKKWLLVMFAAFWAVARKHAVLRHEYESIGGAHTCVQREEK